MRTEKENSSQGIMFITLILYSIFLYDYSVLSKKCIPFFFLYVSIEMKYPLNKSLQSMKKKLMLI